MLFALVILLATGLSGVYAAATATGSQPLWHAVPPFVPLPPSPSPTAPAPVSIVATGDLAPGVDIPVELRHALRADLVTGSLQGRIAPDAAGRLRAAGFTIINGYGSGIRLSGARGAVTRFEVHGTRISVLGFSFDAWSNSITDLAAARRAVAAAATGADLVVVHAHMGAPGGYRTTAGPERHRGVNRGDPARFAHAVVDAGADLVLGHGPGVLRGMEFYRGRLIAYSLGTFTAAGPRTGRAAAAGVLRVRLSATGGWVDGTFTATRTDRAGRPGADRTGLGLRYVRELSAADFRTAGPAVAPTGHLSGG
ncbi:CapA family protein [Catenuloplanes japonicus]|uniref:CapA family protein n=1 Tax=Catenuloplanes japonicus TaxID=33876 RepID=UPI00068E756B|nr:CapA family protein [Catenuloplanes japonicus]